MGKLSSNICFVIVVDKENIKIKKIHLSYVPCINQSY